MSTQSERDKIAELDKKVAVIDTKLVGMIDKQAEQGADIKSLISNVQNLSVVKMSDFIQFRDTILKRLEDIDNSVSMLESNASFWTTLKRAIGERALQVLVFVILSLLLFGVVHFLSSSTLGQVLQGSSK